MPDHTVVKNRSNTKTLLVCSGAVAGMFALTFASVPLYQLFCQVTGYGGTPQVVDSSALHAAANTSGEKHSISVRFDANVNSDLPWNFRASTGPIQVIAGEEHEIFYIATNTSEKTTYGVASFNVAPESMGQYFNKLDCFCFEGQTLAGGQQANMGVSFFVSPEWANDPEVSSISEITLSYTFFPDEIPDLAHQSNRTTGLPQEVF